MNSRRRAPAVHHRSGEPPTPTFGRCRIPPRTDRAPCLALAVSFACPGLQRVVQHVEAEADGAVASGANHHDRLQSRASGRRAPIDRRRRRHPVCPSRRSSGRTAPRRAAADAEHADDQPDRGERQAEAQMQIGARRRRRRPDISAPSMHTASSTKRAQGWSGPPHSRRRGCGSRSPGATGRGSADWSRVHRRAAPPRAQTAPRAEEYRAPAEQSPITPPAAWPKSAPRSARQDSGRAPAGGVHRAPRRRRRPCRADDPGGGRAGGEARHVSSSEREPAQPPPDGAQRAGDRDRSGTCRTGRRSAR